MTTKRQIDKDIEKWIIEREIDKSQPAMQFMKLAEEVGELSAAITREGSRIETVDGIGDVYISLKSLAMTLGLDMDSCIYYSYNQIKNRSGHKRNGIFIKEE